MLKVKAKSCEIDQTSEEFGLNSSADMLIV